MTNHWLKSGSLLVQNNAIEYACYGPSPLEAPTLVLLHEGLGCVALWKTFPQRLSEVTRLGVFVYSRAGYGQSDPVQLPRPIDYMSREAKEVLPEIVSTMGIQEFLLVGHSDGATISAIYAGNEIENGLLGIVLIAPHFFAEAITLKAIKEAKKAYQETALKQRLAQYHRNPDNAFYGWNDCWLHPDFKNWNVSEVIEHFSVPVLAIQGREDQYGTLAQIDIIREKSPTPVSTSIIDHCKHAPFLEHEDAVLQAVEDFNFSLNRH